MQRMEEDYLRAYQQQLKASHALQEEFKRKHQEHQKSAKEEEDQEPLQPKAFKKHTLSQSLEHAQSRSR